MVSHELAEQSHVRDKHILKPIAKPECLYPGKFIKVTETHTLLVGNRLEHVLFQLDVDLDTLNVQCHRIKC